MKVKITDRIIGVTVIGVGRIGKVHLRNVLANPRLEPLWLVDLEREYVEAVRDEFHIPTDQCNVTTFDDIAPALRDERVGLILILTPTDTHPSMIELCLNKENGQPIFCEKPISVNTDEVLKCYRLAQEAGVQLMCGFNRRFDPTYHRMEDLVRKEAGQIQSIHATLASNPSPTRQFLKQCHSNRNGVIFYDTGTHFVDLILWLLNGEMPTEVHSIGHSFTEMFKEYDEPDLTMTTLKFPSGAMVVIELGYVSSVKFDMRLEVRGTGGVVQADNPAPTGVRRITPQGRVHDGLADKLWDRFGESYYNEMDYMADIAQGKKTVDITGEHCAKVADVVDTMRKSYYQKKSVFLNDQANGKQ